MRWARLVQEQDCARTDADFPERREALARTALAAGAGPDMAAATAWPVAATDQPGMACHACLTIRGLLRMAAPMALRCRGSSMNAAARCWSMHGTASPIRRWRWRKRKPLARSRPWRRLLPGVTNSHHSGAMGLPVARLAGQGLVALAFTIRRRRCRCRRRAPADGHQPDRRRLPRRGGPPLVIDMALSEVARQDHAGRQGRPPDPRRLGGRRVGRPTTDPKAALSARCAMWAGLAALLRRWWWNCCAAP